MNNFLSVLWMVWIRSDLLNFGGSVSISTKCNAKLYLFSSVVDPDSWYPDPKTAPVPDPAFQLNSQPDPDLDTDPRLDEQKLKKYS
jgi:hypothetical protein